MSSDPKGLSGPALRALANAGIGSMSEVARWTDADLIALHGFGPRGLRVVRDALPATAGTAVRATAYELGALRGSRRR